MSTVEVTACDDLATQLATTGPRRLPEHRADEDLAVIRNTFFVHDCVLLRDLLNPEKLAFFKRVLEAQYAEDDLLHATGAYDERFKREYSNGWIWEPRLRKATGNAFGYEDIVACKRLYDVMSTLLGPVWQKTSASQIRRMTVPERGLDWGSWTTYHLDAQWGVDHVYFINVWAPFTPCGVTAPGLEFLLASADYMREYARYNPALPYEPRGPGGINPRLDYEAMREGPIRAAFHLDRFWVPELQPGDVMLFSSWCTHRTYVTPGMPDTRISLEWRVGVEAFDSPERPAVWR
jgi:hypothetical protein